MYFAQAVPTLQLLQLGEAPGPAAVGPSGKAEAGEAGSVAWADFGALLQTFRAAQVGPRGDAHHLHVH